eukprot:g4551.t1
MRALDVGCGSGYLAAVMARMVGVEGKVVAMDYLSPLVALSLENLRKTDADLIDSGTLQVEQGDGWKGFEKASPYDSIHVGAAAESVPEALLEQLKPGGRMVIPVGTTSQQFCTIDSWRNFTGTQTTEPRDSGDTDRLPNGNFEQKSLMGVMYVQEDLLGALAAEEDARAAEMLARLAPPMHGYTPRTEPSTNSERERGEPP